VAAISRASLECFCLFLSSPPFSLRLDPACMELWREEMIS